MRRQPLDTVDDASYVSRHRGARSELHASTSGPPTRPPGAHRGEDFAMIIAFACSDQALNRLADMSVEALSRALWIDLLDATPDEIDRVQKATGLAVPTEAEVSEIETS